MPTKKARQKPLTKEEMRIELLLNSPLPAWQKAEIRAGRIPEGLEPKSASKVKKEKTKPEVKEAKKEKPKPKVKAKKERKLRIHQLAALYEYYHRNTVLDDFSKCPATTIAEATELVKGIDPSDLESWPEVDRLYKNYPAPSRENKNVLVQHKYDDLREFKNAVIEKEIYVGISIPLFIEHLKIELNDPIMLTFSYSWSAYIKTMIERKKKRGEVVQSRHASTVKDGTYCFEIECNAEQAKILERYCEVSHSTLIAAREYLKTLGKRAPYKLDKISSKLATQIRAEHSFEDVPRSLIVSALNGYAHKVKFDPSKEFKKELNRFYLKDSFKLQEDSLTVGKAKDIAIRKVVCGEPLTFKVVGVSFQRVTPLIYTVAIQYDEVEYHRSKFSK